MADSHTFFAFGFREMIASRSLVVYFGVLLATVFFLSNFEVNYVEILSSTSRRLVEHLAPGQHKDLFPLDASDYWGTFLVAIGLLIAAAGGIGGGGILVPLLLLVYGFSPKHAIALSNFCIVGSSITNMVSFEALRGGILFFAWKMPFFH